MSREKLKPMVKLSKQFNTRWSSRDWVSIKEYADESGVTVSVWIRAVVLKRITALRERK